MSQLQLHLAACHGNPVVVAYPSKRFIFLKKENAMHPIVKDLLSLEREIETHSSIFAWKIPGTEEPGGLQSAGSQGVGHV